NMFGAGTDTTSSSLVWAIGELLRNPRVMKKLQQEARKIGRGRPMIPEDVEKMPYLKLCSKKHFDYMFQFHYSFLANQHKTLKYLDMSSHLLHKFGLTHGP
ncbi:hypothetical protein R6Q57_011449, partial [Mikania cordata]